MTYAGLRGFLELLRREREIASVEREVDPVHEVSALIKRSGGKTLFCHRVKGSEIPLVANVLGDYRKLEILFGACGPGLIREYQSRLQRPIPPRVVPDGPVKEVVRKGEEVNLGELPIPTINEMDGGPYISAGVIVAKDPEYGVNLSLQRLHLRSRNETCFVAHPSTHMRAYSRRAEERGEGQEIAVVIGCDPVLHIASQVTRGIHVNEYELAGAMRGGPIPLVKCETVDLEVPADAEIILEGVIPPHVREDEGPFGEYTGYYHGSLEQRNRAPIVQYRCVTHRKNPVFQSVYLGKPPTEGAFMRALPACTDLYHLLSQVVPEVRDIHFTPGGCGRFHVVVSIRKRSAGEGKLALGAILSSPITIKHAVVVDDDIDVRNMDEVEWAIATRSQFDRDAIVMTGVPGQLDPSRDRVTQLITKVGIDATRPDNVRFPEICDVPKAVMEKVSREFEEMVATDPERILQRWNAYW